MTLDPEHLDQIRDRLTSRQAELSKSVGSHVGSLIDEGDIEQGGMDSGDIANQSVDADAKINRAYREAYELSLVEYALQRLENGEYGSCVDCGESVESERLLANPIAKRCLGCQENRENTQDERDATPSL